MRMEHRADQNSRARPQFGEKSGMFGEKSDLSRKKIGGYDLFGFARIFDSITPQSRLVNAIIRKCESVLVPPLLLSGPESKYWIHLCLFVIVALD